MAKLTGRGNRFVEVDRYVTGDKASTFVLRSDGKILRKTKPRTSFTLLTTVSGREGFERIRQLF